MHSLRKAGFTQSPVGSDYMRGGTGDDGYDVDSTGDSVIEDAGEGEDTVYSWISYTLGANVEHLLLYGGAINGTGNALANDIDGIGGNNVLRGEAGDDELDGWLGNDTMYGGTGHDVFHVDQAGDVVIEYLDQGIDEVISHDRIHARRQCRELAPARCGWRDRRHRQRPAQHHVGQRLQQHFLRPRWR